MTNNSALKAEDLNLEDLQPIVSSRKSRDNSASVSITAKGVYVNPKFVANYLLTNEGYAVLFRHPKANGMFFLGFYENAGDILEQHKSIALKYKKGTDGGILVISNYITDNYEKTTRMSGGAPFEKWIISAKTFFLIMPKTKPGSEASKPIQ